MELALQQEKAKQLRADIIKMLYLCQSGHPGGSLSLVEMLMAIYYNTAHVDPKNPKWEDRDRIVLSKGHGCPAQYAILADLGFFPREDLWTLRKLHSHLQGHPDCKKVPGVDISTGSLGQGISVACGMACAAKKKGSPARVYCVLGDGEIQEGQVWEAAMSAGHYKLDNLVAFLDNNNLQIDGAVDHVMSVYPIKEKFESFGWRVIELDGNDVGQILAALELARTSKGQPRAFGFDLVELPDGNDLDAVEAALSKPTMPGKPKAILAHTVKGKGVSFMENQAGWHGSAINDEQYAAAMKELKERYAQAEKGCAAE